MSTRTMTDDEDDDNRGESGGRLCEVRWLNKKKMKNECERVESVSVTRDNPKASKCNVRDRVNELVNEKKNVEKSVV